MSTADISKRSLRSAGATLFLVLATMAAGGWQPQAHAEDETQAAVIKAPPHGVVLDVGGAPANGAEVLLVHRHSPYSRDYRDAVVEKVTANDRGKFRFTKPLRFASHYGSLTGEHYALLTKRGQEAGWKLIAGMDPDGGEQTLRLEAGRAVSVKLQRTDGTPVPNGTVWISLASHRDTHEEVRLPQPVGWIEGRTNAEGLATLEGVPVSAWQVRANAEGFLHSPDAPNTIFPKGGVNPSGVKTVIVTLEPSASFDGVVEDPDGVPVPGLPLLIKSTRGSDQEATRFVTDAQGRFRVDGLVPRGRDKIWEWNVWATGEQWTSRPVAVLLKPGEHQSDVVVQVISGALVRGLARDPGSRKPIAGALMAVMPNADSQLSFPATWTDENGWFEFRVPHGRLSVAIANLPAGWCMTGEDAVGTRYLVVDTQRMQELIVETGAPLKRFVTVRGRTDPPVADARVVAHAIAEDRVVGTGRADIVNGAARWVTTDAEGRFEANEWPENTELTLLISNAKSRREGWKKISTGQGLDIAEPFRLEETFTVEVLAKDPQGEPLAGRTLEIFPTFNSQWIGMLPDVKTGKNGTCKVAQILPGLTYEVRDSEDILNRKFLVLLPEKPTDGMVPTVEVTLSRTPPRNPQ